MADEKILVVAREKILESGEFQGFLPLENFDNHEKLITQNQEFLWRSVMETDPKYKQIIPYLIFQHEDSYFLMRRRSDASEARLKDKYTLGIGGHIRQDDIQDKSLEHWAAREFDEEVSYTGQLTITPIGLINDDSNLVGQVHLGLVFLLQGDNASISVKSELKEGNLLSLEDIKTFYDRMETWSQMAFDFLSANKNIIAQKDTCNRADSTFQAS